MFQKVCWSPSKDRLELAFTLAFDLEIIIRFLAYLPDWRSFFYRKRNCFDLFLAIACSIIQIPAISNSTIYPWLTVFQLIRWYRVILAFPRMKPLLVTVFGSFSGLLNMVIFLFLMNFLGALMVCRFILSWRRKGVYSWSSDRLCNCFAVIWRLENQSHSHKHIIHSWGCTRWVTDFSFPIFVHSKSCRSFHPKIGRILYMILYAPFELLFYSLYAYS